MISFKKITLFTTDHLDNAGLNKHLEYPLIIHDENTKENHNRIVRSYVIKTRFSRYKYTFQKTLIAKLSPVISV